MSLINDALKRTEKAKRGDEPAIDDDAPPMVPVLEDQMRRRRSWALLALLVLSGSGIAVLVWKHSGDEAKPAAASAETPQRSPAAPLAIRRAPEIARDRTPARASKAVIVRKPAVEVSPEAELAFAKTIEELNYYEPPARPAPKAGGEPTTRPSEPEAKDATPPAEPAATPAPKPTIRPKPRPRLPHYKLSGILQGPEGGCAIINDQFIREGETIDGAKVVKIRRYDVELDYQGARVTLRM